MIHERTFPVFPGHFDDRPLVPGAALLAWVQACVPGLLHLDRVRFSAPVVPGELVSLAVTLDGDAVTFEVYGSDKVRMRGSGRRATST